MNGLEALNNLVTLLSLNYRKMTVASKECNDMKAEENFNIVVKELRAFEIIKEKRVWVDALIEMSLKEYNTYCKDVWNTPDLTKEEYELLNEVLL